MRIPLLAAALLVACSRKAPPPSIDGGAIVVRDAGVQVDAATPPVFGDGAHDYRGTLGARSSLGMHLVRAGDRVSGAYAYTNVGKSIALDGTLAADGGLALDESAGGKVTGHFALSADGRGFTGTWSDPARKKTFPVTLGPGAPLAILAGGGGGPASANQRAEDCLADIDCPAAEAERLFLAADAAANSDLDCTRFLEGVGVARNEVRGRACLERTRKAAPCESGDVDMELGTLLELRIDGTGGPRDIEGVQTFLAGCPEDTTVQSLRLRAEAVAASPSDPPISFCSMGSTRVVWDACASRESRRERDRVKMLYKEVAHPLDAKGREVFRNANAAFDDFVNADVVRVDTALRGVAGRTTSGSTRENELQAERAGALAAFAGWTAPEVAAEDERRARTELAEALVAAASRPATPDQDLGAEKQALANAHAAWTRYRDAEIAFHVHVFGASHGGPRVRAAVATLLTKQWSKACAAPSNN